MKEPKREADRWLRQAENDLAYATVGLREGFAALVCFQCQQVCEKAVKALRYARGERVVLGYALVELAASLEVMALRERPSRRLATAAPVPESSPRVIPDAMMTTVGRGVPTGMVQGDNGLSGSFTPPPCRSRSGGRYPRAGNGPAITAQRDDAVTGSSHRTRANA